MEKMVAITKIGIPRITKTGKNIVDINVKELSTKQFFEVGIFKGKDDFPFNVGNEVVIDITAKEFNGKTYYSSSIEKIAPVISVIKENPKDKVPQEVWENKDKRIGRMNSLSHAVEIFKLSKENKTVEGEGYETIIECVKTIAEQLETWIYNGTTKKGDPEVSCFEE